MILASIKQNSGSHPPGRAALSHPIDRAIRFLLAARKPDGWWRDFDTLAGSSDEWVSAVVAHALAGTQRRDALAAAHELWSRLARRQSWSGGWAYNRRVPSDADSTLWALNLGRRLAVTRSFRMRRARAFIGRHLRANGGVATYASSGPIRLFTEIGSNFSFAGWCDAHVCVTALAASTGVLTGPRTLDFLRRAQLGDGSWEAYWWCDPEYATALAVRAFSGAAHAEDDSRVARAIAWATSRMDAVTALANPFAAALRLSILSSRPQSKPARDAALVLLLESQGEDGSWSSSARLRIPPPNVIAPNEYSPWIEGARGGGGIILDFARCFTTATALDALAEAERLDG